MTTEDIKSYPISDKTAVLYQMIEEGKEYMARVEWAVGKDATEEESETLLKPIRSSWNNIEKEIKALLFSSIEQNITDQNGEI